MSRSYVSKELRRKVADQARHRCGYCLTQELIAGLSMEIEHIIPEAEGGATEETNLWLSCTNCNEFKGVKTRAIDPDTSEMVALFNPRQQNWSEHFAWSKAGDLVIAKTPTGRATILALQLNRPILVAARQLWVKFGLHPPQD